MFVICRTQLLLLLSFTIVFIIEIKSAPVPKTCEHKEVEACIKLIPPNDTAPSCNETKKTEAEICFDKLADKCPDQLEIEFYLEKFKLIQKAMCKTIKSGGTGLRFKENPKCWAKTDECLDKLVTPHRMLPGKVCEYKKNQNDQCKVKQEILWECKEIHAVFLEHAFQESQCTACNHRLNSILFTLLIAVIFFYRSI